MQRPPKWKTDPSTPTATKQSKLDNLFAGSTMARKSSKAKNNVQSMEDAHNNANDSIETMTPVSSLSKMENTSAEKGLKGSATKRKRTKPELELSPTRCSPRLQAKKSRLVPKPKYSLSLIESPPLPVPQPSRPLPGLPAQIFTSLSIATREDQYPVGRSPSEPTPSFHTALSSPIHSSNEVSLSAESAMDIHEEDSTTEHKSVNQNKEIPSSLPLENTPSDGIADAWPSSQSDSSPTKISQSKSMQRSQPRYDDGFRIPDPPSSRMSLDDTQDESQASPSFQHSPPRRTSQTRQLNPFHTSDGLNRHEVELDDTQDDSQPLEYQPPPYNEFHVAQAMSLSKGNLDETQDLTQESEHEVPAVRKRKRESSIFEIPDSAPLEDTLSQLPSRKTTEFVPLEDSCVQPPPSMRKKTPEVINIHTTQSQTQEYIPTPGPRPTSQDLSKPFGHTDSDNSSSSSVHQPSHNWESSQVTQSPISALAEFSSVVNPPSQLQLSSQNDLSRIPVPLAMAVEYELPSRGFSNMPDLDRMEEEGESNLRKWEAEKYTPKPKRK